MKITLFVLLLVSSLSANDYWKLALEKKLYDESFWNLLLHNVNGESEIDDKDFFLAEDGKYSAKSEMKATIDSLLHETTFEDNATACRFPARKRFLQESLNIPDSAFVSVRCIEYEKVKKRLEPTSATLVFPSGHKNSPSSMFGHSFIRIDTKSKSKLLSYAVNYAAFTDENNGFVYAIGGLMGGYQGRYSLLPYHEKIKEYVNTEQRDIWEYDLNLTPQETLIMFEHIWEMNNTFSMYYFFTENCSYNLLWFLEVARPGVHLRDYFFYEVIPVETIFAINDENLITKTHYRPSRYKKILALSKYMTKSQQKEAVAIALGDKKPGDLVEDDMQIKRYILQTAVEYLQYKNSQGTLKAKTPYRKRFLSILSALSKLGRGEKLKVTRSINPLKGHRAVRMSLSSGTRNEDGYSAFSFRPSFHDLDDNDDGFIKGTHIEFFNTEISHFDDELRLERMNLLEIESFSPRDIFFDPTSWRIKLAWDRDFKDDVIRPSVSLGMGFSWNSDYGFIYTMADVRGYYKTHSNGSFGGSFGGVWNQAKKAKLVFESSYHYFDDGFHQRINSASENITLGQNHALSLSYQHIQKTFGDDERILFHYRFYY